MLATSIPSRALSVREGVVIGVLGATVVALCYLLVDLVRGLPLLTPSILGEVILHHQSVPSESPNWVMAGQYTVFHFAVFTAFGIVLGAIAGWARTNAIARYALAQLFVVFVLFAWGILGLMSNATKGFFPVILVLGANLIAAWMMGMWLWIQHPSLRAAVKGNDLGGSDHRDIVTSDIRDAIPSAPRLVTPGRLRGL